MELSPILLSKLLLFSFLFGIFIGILNDVNRIVRVFIGVRYAEKDFTGLYSFFHVSAPRSVNGTKRGFFTNILIFFGDLLLFIVMGIGIVLLNFYYNDGRFRLYTVLATALGAVLYYYSLGRLVISVSEPIMIFLRFLIYQIIKLFFMPIKFIINIICSIVKKIYEIIRKELEKNYNIRYNKKEVENYLLLSELGFVGETNTKEYINES